MAKRLVTVTEDDIRNGTPGNCETCPVALAAKRAYPEASDVYVYEKEISVVVTGGYCHTTSYQQWLPDAARNFVRDFDAKGADAVEPFSVELELV